jgi:hypothetical protein
VRHPVLIVFGLLAGAALAVLAFIWWWPEMANWDEATRLGTMAIVCAGALSLGFLVVSILFGIVHAIAQSFRR